MIKINKMLRCMHTLFLIILPIILFTNFVSSQDIEINKNIYFIGDTVEITFKNYSTEISAVIKSDYNYYKFLGSPNEVIKFIPDKKGRYIVSIIDDDLNEVESLSFDVIPEPNLVRNNNNLIISTGYEDNSQTIELNNKEINNKEINNKEINNNGIFISKKIYNINDIIKISITHNGCAQIIIKNDDDTYKYLGNRNDEISFVPIKAGIYNIILKDSTDTSIAVERFEVVTQIKNKKSGNDSNYNILNNSFFENKQFSNTNKNDKSPAAYKQFYSLYAKKKSKNITIFPNIRDKDNNFIKAKLKTLSKEIENYNIGGVQFLEFEPQLIIELQDLKNLRIRYNGINLSSGLRLKISKLNKNNVAGLNNIKNSFFIENQNHDYYNGFIDYKANGYNLYSCEIYDLDLNICYSGWQKELDTIPGENYSIELTSSKNVYAETGLATINTLKPLYHPNEQVDIIFVILDRLGHLVSDANLDVEIIDPKDNIYFISTKDYKIIETSRGIYKTNFLNSNFTGNYSIKVSAAGENVGYTMFSYFIVKEFYKFDILRKTPVTVDPWQGPFFSTIKIDSFIDVQTFSYTEKLPIEITVIDQGNALLTYDDIYSYLTWNNLNDGDMVWYLAQTPPITPNLYEIGPSIVEYSDQNSGQLLFFNEARTWQLAVDPLLQINATECNKMIGTRADNTYTTACRVPWSIDIEDTITQSAAADRNVYCGIETAHDQTLTHCAGINKVEACIDWWFTGAVKVCVGQDYSINAGTAWSNYAVSCPTSDGSLLCANLTGSAAWNCTSFSSGNSMLRSHLRSNTDGANCEVDALFFRVNYSAYPDVTGNVTNDGPKVVGENITFTGVCTDLDAGDTFQLVVCNASAAICNAATSGDDLICKGSLGTSTSPVCSYTTLSADIGTNSGDKAVCCDADENCDPAPVSVNDWTVESLAGTPVITIYSVGGDTIPTYSFIDPTPIVNSSTNRPGYCYLSEVDESFSDMVTNGRVNCGLYTKDTAKICEYTTSLEIGLGADTLYMSCNNTHGGENGPGNNSDMTIEVLCDSHLDCIGARYCNYQQQCVLDQLAGFTCLDLAYGNGEDNEVCTTGAGASSICINDSSYSYTGYYCTSDNDDCVYNSGYYDLNYFLCEAASNDYRSCGTGNMWGSLIECADSGDPYNQSATASSHTGYACGYYSSPQSCISGDIDLGTYGCNGAAFDCGSYVYLGGSVCGSVLADCDVGCEGECDVDNSTTPGIISEICYYDKTCSNVCLWSQNSEEAPSFCIDDSNGGSCVYDNRTSPANAETCYYSVSCANTIGANLDSSGTLREDYCDYCTVSGNISGDYSQIPNPSCLSNCSDSGTLYYDTGATPSNRSDDCDGAGNTSIESDTLTIGDIWDGTGQAYCDDTECDNDVGLYLDGTCSLGVCTASDSNAPIIILSTPYNNTWENTTSVVFYFNVTDLGSGIENCSILIDGTINDTKYYPTESIWNNFTKTLSNGQYNWSILCYDNSSNHNYNSSENMIAGVDTTYPQLNNPQISGTIFNISDTICLKVNVSDTYSGIDSVWAKIKLPSSSFVDVYLYDDETTSCDSINYDGIYSVEYTLEYAGIFNWTIAYANDFADNQNSIPACLTWNVTEGGNLSVNMTQPSINIEINESEYNYYFAQTCIAKCELGSVNCEGVEIYPQYKNNSLWVNIETISTYLLTNISNYSCGDMVNDTTCQYTFNISANENTGNNVFPIRCKASSTNSPTTFSDSLNVTVNDYPTAKINYPTESLWVNGIININASNSFDSDGSIINYLYELDNNTLFSTPSTLCDTADNNCSFNTTSQNQCIDSVMGCYIRLTVTDDNGLTNSTIVLFGIDNTGPVSTLDRPLSFENITSANYNLNSTISDSGVSIISLVMFEYRINSTESWSSACNDTDGSAPFECSLNLTSFDDGVSYEFRVYSNDSLGNLGGYDTHTDITIDKTGPNSALISPVNYDNISTNLFIVNVTSLDEISNVDTVVLEYKQNPTDDWHFICANSSGTDYYSCIWNVTLLSDGNQYIVHAYANDSLGNIGNSVQSINITIDRTGPATTINDPLTGSDILGAGYTLNASAVDTYSLIDTAIFEYRINSTDTWKSACNATNGPDYFTCSWDISSLDDGNDYEIRARSNDTLGNLGGYDTETSITLDNQGPEINLISPGNASIDADGSIMFEYNVIDKASGVSNCSLYINNIWNQSNNTISESSSNYFYVSSLVNGDYNWSVECTDNFVNQNTNKSDTWGFTIDIKYDMYVNTTTDKFTYELGNQLSENVNISAIVTDYYGNPLDINIDNDIIFGMTNHTWWNTSWEKRIPIYITESSGSNRTNVNIEVNITGLGGLISSCVDEIRIISLDKSEKTVNIIDGDDSTYCLVIFEANITGGVSGEEMFFAYYNNSAASDPGYQTLIGSYYNVFFDDFNAGTDFDPLKWTETGGNWDILSQMAHSSNPRSFHFIATIANLLNLSVYDSGNLTFYWEISSNLESGDCLRLDFYNGTWNNNIWLHCDDYTTSGTENIEISLGYMIDDFRLEFGADTDSAVEYAYLDNINLTVYSFADIYISAATGTSQKFIERDSADTGYDGIYNFIWDNSLDIDIGNYSAVCYAEKAIFTDAEDGSQFEYINDTTDPNVTLIWPEPATEHNSSVTFQYTVNDTLSSIINCSLFIDNNLDKTNSPIQEGPVQFFYPYIPQAGWHNWSVCCYDYYLNLGCSENRSIFIKPPDLEINSDNINVTNSTPKLGQQINITATITNIGGSNAYDIIAQFYEEDPLFGGVQIGNNFTFNLTDMSGDNYSINLTQNYTVSKIGPTNIFVVVDPPTETNGTIFELREYNNKNYTTINVGAWTTTFGNISSLNVLGNYYNETVLSWNKSNFKTNIFATEKGLNINWINLQSIGLKIDNTTSTNNDFEEIDAELNMTGFLDSINQTFTENNLPKTTASLIIYSKNISSIPIINSTVNDNFISGLLWDMSDGNQEYNGSQDIVFVSVSNNHHLGAYGYYDYEISYPAPLKNYKDEVYDVIEIYYELT